MSGAAKSAIPIQRHDQGRAYTPVSKRQDRPAAIAWILRHHPELTDAQVQRLFGTTKDTINKIRDRTHWNIQQIKPTDPVSLGICTQTELALQSRRLQNAGARPLPTVKSPRKRWHPPIP